MQTLVDPFEIQAALLVRHAAEPARQHSVADFEITWDDAIADDPLEEDVTEIQALPPPGVPGETWQRARGWSSDD
jgi:hypothetical protein